MPELGDLNIAVLLGGPFTLAGFVWLARMFVQYQRDFTEQYRARMHVQDEQIAALRAEVDVLARRHRDCLSERQALRVTVRQAGISWNPDEWVNGRD